MDDVENPVLQAQEIDRFQGRIYMLKNGQEIPLRLSRSSDKFHWGIAPEDDWLQVGGSEQPPALEFTFLAQADNRLHFDIRGTGRCSAKKLGISRNGYLGLYFHAEVKDFWKLEPLAWTEKGLVCRWRDHLGTTVKATSDRRHYEPGEFCYLSTEAGEACEFLVVKVD